MERLRQRGPRFVVRLPWLVIAVWVGAAIVLNAFAPSIREAGTTDPQEFLPADLPSFRAQQLLEQAWGEEAFGQAAMLVTVREDGLTADDRAFLERLETELRTDPEVRTIQSIHSAPNLAPFLESAEGDAVLTIVGFRSPPFTAPTIDAVERVRAAIGGSVPEGLDAHLTGPAAIGTDQARAIEDSFSRTAVVTLLLVLGILIYVYRSPMAVLVPLATIGVAFAVARALVGFLAATGFQVSTMIETFMIVMVFGAGTDYCLFLFMRYREERRRGGPDAGRAVPLARTLRVVGFVVAASGATVVLAFASQALTQFGIYRSMGPAIGIAIGITVLAALTLTPAIAAVLGRWAFWPTRPEQEGPPSDPWWGRVAGAVTARPARVLAVGLVLLAVPALAATQLRLSFNILGELPADADSRQGFDALSERFPGGRLSPAFIVVRSPDGVTDEASFELMREITAAVRDLDGVAEVRSAPLPLGEPITFDHLRDFEDLGAASDVAPDPEALDRVLSEISTAEGLVITPELVSEAPMLAEPLEMFVSPEGNVARIMLVYDGDPFSNDATRWLEGVAEVVDEVVAGRAALAGPGDLAAPAVAADGTEVLFGGPTAFYGDMLRIGAEDFRQVIWMVSLIVLLILGLFLRSVLAPLYLLGTVLLSFAAALGATVLVFQGILGHEGISLWVPPFLFIVLVAVGSDYNIFVMSRVSEEYRRTGDMRVAARTGLEHTGRVVTSAGLTLAGAFVALVAAPMPNLQQVGFAIALGVLVDTFVVRTLVVPSVATLLGPRTWWPRRSTPDGSVAADEPVFELIGGGR